MKTSSVFMENQRSIPLHPPLARTYGDRAALVLQQIRYWLQTFEEAERALPAEKRKHFREGRWWVFNSYEAWRASSFDFWSRPTIERIFAKLEKAGVLLAQQFNMSAGDATKWYSIDFEELDRQVGAKEAKRTPSHQIDVTPSHQNDEAITSNCGDHDRKMMESKDKDTESTTESITQTPPPVPDGEQRADPTAQPEAPEPKPRRKTKHQLMFEAVCVAFGYDWNAVTKSKRANVGRVASELLAGGAKPEDVPPFYRWCEGHKWTEFTENVFATRWDNYKKLLPAFRPTGNGAGKVHIPRPVKGCHKCGGETGALLGPNGESLPCPACLEAEKGVSGD